MLAATQQTFDCLPKQPTGVVRCPPHLDWDNVDTRGLACVFEGPCIVGGRMVRRGQKAFRPATGGNKAILSALLTARQEMQCAASQQVVRLVRDMDLPDGLIAVMSTMAKDYLGEGFDAALKVIEAHGGIGVALADIGDKHDR